MVFKFDYGSKTLEDDIKEYYTYAAANACVTIPEIAGNAAYKKYAVCKDADYLWDGDGELGKWSKFYNDLILKRLNMLDVYDSMLKVESLYKDDILITSGNIRRLGANTSQVIYPLIVKSVKEAHYNNGEPYVDYISKKIFHVGYTITKTTDSKVYIDIEFFDSYGNDNIQLIKLKEDAIRIAFDYKSISIHDLSDMDCEISDAYMVTDESFSRVNKYINWCLTNNEDLREIIINRTGISEDMQDSDVDDNDEVYYPSIEDTASTITSLAIMHMNVALSYDDDAYRPFCKELDKYQIDHLSKRRNRMNEESNTSK